MRTAIIGESSADEAALAVIAEALLGRPLKLVKPAIEHDGWPFVRQVLPRIYKHLHYHTDVEAMIVVVDSDDSPPPRDQPEQSSVMSRYEELESLLAEAKRTVSVVNGRATLKVAIGVAVPAIEAWLRFGVDPHVNEPTWFRALRDRKFPYDRPRLKKAVYGVDRPDLRLETIRMVEEARRVSQNLDGLERLFPHGFGQLARAIRSWRE